MRWWWLGPDVEHRDLERQLRAMAEAGIGGVEVAYVYPLAPVRHPFLSPGFLAALRFAAETAESLGLRFDLTLCSGWPFGGPHVSPANVSRGVVWDVREVGAGPVEVRLAPRWPGEQFLAAYVGDGSRQEPPAGFERLPAQGGVVRLGPGRGPRLVALAWSAPTGQQVKRAAAGADGPALDHYSAAATREHLAAVAEPLLAAAGAERVGSVFCDSLEVYGADWTPGLPAEYAARHGRELLDELWMLRFDSPGSAGFRGRYYELLAELFEQNFLRVIREWAAERGVPFRVQNYGVPPTRMSGYRWADLVEGEGWGWRGLPQTRWAASAAHRLGREVVSAEVWTWVHSPSLRATPLDLLGEAHEHLLLGINQFVGHGWPASPADAPGVGRLFYASGALDDRNAWWPAMPALSAYLGRLCWLLRQGRPVADVALYLPTADARAALGDGMPGGHGLDLWRACRDRIGEEIPGAIRDAGLDFDLVDDELLAELDPAAVAGPVVLPRVSLLPERTRAWLRAFEAAGGAVIEAASAAGLGALLQASVAPDLRIAPASDEIGFVHRRLDDVDVYFVANTGPHTRAVTVTPRAPGGRWQRWDARADAVLAEGTRDAPIPLELAPYEAAVLVVGDELPAVDAPAAPEPARATRLDAPWSVSFPGTAPQPVALPHDWAPERPHFAGAAVYEHGFDSGGLWGERVPARALLDFGDAVPLVEAEGGASGIRGSSYRALVEPPVREAAHLEVNGVDCGLLYAPPYRAEVAHALHPGHNTVRVTVMNASAAALTDPAARAALEADVARSRELYGSRFRMQDLDRAADGLRSGLLTVPVLRW
jgi:hypothetical protein